MALITFPSTDGRTTYRIDDSFVVMIEKEGTGARVYTADSRTSKISFLSSSDDVSTIQAQCYTTTGFNDADGNAFAVNYQNIIAFDSSLEILDIDFFGSKKRLNGITAVS